MEKNKKCKLIIFSDIHYLDERPKELENNLTRKLTQYSTILLDKLIFKINNIHVPDVSINLGDLIEDKYNHDQDIKNFKYIWKKFREIKTPFYSVIGNHDLRMMNSTKEILNIMNYEKASFSIDINGYHLIILCTEIREELGLEDGGIYKTQYVSLKDITWLKEDLDRNQLPCLIFTHFGLAEDDMYGNWWFSNNPENALLKNRREIKKIIKDNENVLAVFSGHQHWTKMIEEDGINYYILGSLTENINNDGIPDGVYLEVELEGKKINIEEYHISIN